MLGFSLITSKQKLNGPLIALKVMVVDVTKGGVKEEDQLTGGHHRKGSNVFDYSRLPLCFSVAQSVVCHVGVSFFILAA